MLYNFQNFTLKFINDGRWQQKEANQQNNINITFLVLIQLFQKQTNKLNSKIQKKCKNQNWTLMQKSNEKTPKKLELVARPNILPVVFYL